MCDKIIVDKGRIEIETPQDFIDHFGFTPIIEELSYHRLNMSACLCQIDIKASLDSMDIPHVFEYGTSGDAYVGDIEELEFN